MFDPEEKLAFDNLLFAIQNIGSGNDPSLERAKLRLGCLNAAIETVRLLSAAGPTENPAADVVQCAEVYEDWVVAGYKDASLVRFAVPVPPFKSAV